MIDRGPALDGSHGPHVLVGDVARPSLADDDRHHLERVLRLRPGDLLTVGDGAGRWRPCRFGGEPEPVGPVVEEDAPAPQVGVGFALIKGGRPELVVQKLTEIGVDRIVPFVAERSVVRWDDQKAARNVARFRRVAREAVMQSRRAWSPRVDEVASFAELAAETSAVMADRRGRALGPDPRLVLVGPEGGWSETERRAVLPRVALGPTVLRAETAAIAAGVLACAYRDWGHLDERPANDG